MKFKLVLVLFIVGFGLNAQSWEKKYVYDVFERKTSDYYLESTVDAKCSKWVFGEFTTQFKIVLEDRKLSIYMEKRFLSCHSDAVYKVLILADSGKVFNLKSHREKDVLYFDLDSAELVKELFKGSFRVYMEYNDGNMITYLFDLPGLNNVKY